MTTDELLAQGNALLNKGNAMITQTVAQGSTPYAGSSFSKLVAPTPVPAPTAPTSTKNVNVVSTPQMPNLKPTVGDPATAIAANTAVGDLLKQQFAMNEAQNARDTQQVAQNDSWLKTFLGGQSTQDTRASLEKSAGINKLNTQIQGMITESESLTKDYNATLAERDKRIAALEQNNLGSLDQGVDSRVADTEKLYAIRLNEKSANINAKAAVIQMLQGNLNSARDYINQAVADITADKKDKLAAFVTFQSMNQKLFDSIDSRYADAYKSAIGAAKDEYDNALKEKSTVGELMLKYNSAGAGIGIGDSLQEAYRKASTVAGAGGGDSLTADMKNYNFAVKNGYTGSFADFLGKGGNPTPAYSGGSLTLDQQTAQEAESVGITTNQLIKVQNYLNQGYSLKQIAQDTGMPNSIYVWFANKIQDVTP